MRHFSAGLLAVACLAVPAAVQAAQPQFWQLEGARDFLDGETEGLSVDSEGGVRLAPATRVVQDPEAPYVWSLARDADGRLYVGTSPDGKVYAIDRAGKSEVYFDPADKYIWALAFDDQGRLLVATGSEGRIRRVTAKDK